MTINSTTLAEIHLSIVTSSSSTETSSDALEIEFPKIRCLASSYSSSLCFKDFTCPPDRLDFSSDLEKLQGATTGRFKIVISWTSLHSSSLCCKHFTGPPPPALIDSTSDLERVQGAAAGRFMIVIVWVSSSPPCRTPPTSGLFKIVTFTYVWLFSSTLVGP